jgi:hypothetical protein
MNATLLLSFFLIGTNAFAQADNKTVTIRVLHHSAASAPAVNSHDAGTPISPGYLTLVTADPLVVAEDPVASYVNRAAVVVNRATSSLTVDFKEDIPKQRITVAISYEDGQLLRSASFLPKEREQTVSLPEMKSTTLYASRYNIAVYQDDKRVLYWGQFVK